MTQTDFLHVLLLLCDLSFCLLVYVDERQRTQAVGLLCDCFCVPVILLCLQSLSPRPFLCAHGMFLSELVKILNDH